MGSAATRWVAGGHVVVVSPTDVVVVVGIDAVVVVSPDGLALDEVEVEPGAVVVDVVLVEVVPGEQATEVVVVLDEVVVEPGIMVVDVVTGENWATATPEAGTRTPTHATVAMAANPNPRRATPPTVLTP